MIGSYPNSTIYNTVINSFLCPSDPNADFDRSNSYFASIGSTTYESPINTSGHVRGLDCYGIRDCTDGSSNTIAFAESLTGQDGAGFGLGSQQNTAGGTPIPGQRDNDGRQSGHGGQGADDPQGYYGTSAQFLYASANAAAVISRAADIAPWAGTRRLATYSSMRGFCWADG